MVAYTLQQSDRISSGVATKKKKRSERLTRNFLQLYIIYSCIHGFQGRIQALMSRIERRYCSASTSYMTRLSTIFILLHIWQNYVSLGELLSVRTLNDAYYEERASHYRSILDISGIYNRIRRGEYTISSGEGDISSHPERRYTIASGAGRGIYHRIRGGGYSIASWEGDIASHPGRGIYHRILGGGIYHRIRGGGYTIASGEGDIPSHPGRGI